jgi:large subunit ribosomal protein L10e
MPPRPAPCCRGFTPFLKDDYLEWKREGRLVNDGVNVKLLGNHGPLDAREPAHIFATPAREFQTPLHASDSE